MMKEIKVDQNGKEEPRLIWSLSPSAWAIIGALLFGSGWYLVRAVAARALPLEVFGFFAVILTLQMTLTSISDFGMTYGLSRIIPPLKQKTGNGQVHDLMSIVLAGTAIEVIIIVVLLILQVLGFSWIEKFIMPSHEFSGVYAASILWFAATAICIFVEAIASSFQRFDVRALIMGGRVFWMLLGWIILLIGSGLDLAHKLEAFFIWASMIGLIVLVLGLSVLKKSLSAYGLQKKAMLLLLKTCSATVVVVIVVTTLSNCDLLILSQFVSSDELGLYAAVISCIQIAWSIVIAVMQVYLPRFSNHESVADAQQGELCHFLGTRVYRDSEKRLLITGVVMSVFICLFSRELLIVLFGSKFEKMSLYLMGASLSIPFFTLAQIRLQALLAQGTRGEIRIRTLIGLAWYVLTLAFFVHNVGLKGAPVALCVGYFGLLFIIGVYNIESALNMFRQAAIGVFVVGLFGLVSFFCPSIIRETSYQIGFKVILVSFLLSLGWYKYRGLYSKTSEKDSLDFEDCKFIMR